MDSNTEHDEVTDLLANLTVGELVDFLWLTRGASGAEAGDVTADRFTRAMKINSLQQASLPRPGESAAVSYSLPKTCALCYDRVFGFFAGGIPEHIRFGGKTQGEIGVFARNLFLSCRSQGIKLHKSMAHLIKENFLPEGISYDTSLHVAENQIISIAYAREFGIPVVPVFHTEKEGGRILQTPGDASVLVTTLSDLAIVDEKKLVWEQVQQFREDKDARSKLRRLIHWLDADMIGKSEQFVREEIAKKLDDYEWALKKHGIVTILGTITGALDGKFLTGASAAGALIALLKDPGIATLAATGLVLTKAAVAISEKLIDLEDIRRGPNSEVSFIHEVKRLAK